MWKNEIIWQIISLLVKRSQIDQTMQKDSLFGLPMQKVRFTHFSNVTHTHTFHWVEDYHDFSWLHKHVLVHQIMAKRTKKNLHLILQKQAAPISLLWYEINLYEHIFWVFIVTLNILYLYSVELTLNRFKYQRWIWSNQ